MAQDASDTSQAPGLLQWWNIVVVVEVVEVRVDAHHMLAITKILSSSKLADGKMIRHNKYQ